jgi:hypothetical protein
MPQQYHLVAAKSLFMYHQQSSEQRHLAQKNRIKANVWPCLLVTKLLIGSKYNTNVWGTGLPSGAFYM